LGFLLFVALAFWWGRRSAAARHRDKSSGQATDNAFGKAELGAEGKRRAELGDGGSAWAWAFTGERERRELDGKDNGGLLGDEEKGELERRRAAELEGRQVVSPVEAGWRGERAELEARREAGRYEIG
tara:strand:- start:555 stop:938 length:384 start_codon:yes stop_codon:yes gene_type:complete